jgi:hypothetical protein
MKASRGMALRPDGPRFAIKVTIVSARAPDCRLFSTVWMRPRRRDTPREIVLQRLLAGPALGSVRVADHQVERQVRAYLDECAKSATLYVENVPF